MHIELPHRPIPLNDRDWETIKIVAGQLTGIHIIKVVEKIITTTKIIVKDFLIFP